MTVTTTANSISYAGNGTTTAFAFPYVFFAATDLVVTLVVTATNIPVSPAPVLNGAATYDYTVTGVVSDGEYASGGTVTFNTAPLGTHGVLMQRAVPATQTVALVDNSKFPATTINVEFDKLTILAQQSGYLTTTSLQIPSNEAGLVVTAVPVSGRASKLLSWDALGNLTTIDPTTLIGGSVPAGPASGDLAGAYPGPTIKPGVALTGNPTAPTPAPGDNDTSIATTAFVTSSIAAAPGRLLQTVSTETGAVATGTTTIPLDDTIPQISEGTEFMTLAITPSSATSRLLIEVCWNGSCAFTPGQFAVALFQDATASALATVAINPHATAVMLNLKFTHSMTSGTTSATTFRVRAGSSSAGTTTFNGVTGARQYGGVIASSIVIQEIAP